MNGTNQVAHDSKGELMPYIFDVVLQQSKDHLISTPKIQTHYLQGIKKEQVVKKLSKLGWDEWIRLKDVCYQLCVGFGFPIVWRYSCLFN